MRHQTIAQGAVGMFVVILHVSPEVAPAVDRKDALLAWALENTE